MLARIHGTCYTILLAISLTLFPLQADYASALKGMSKLQRLSVNATEFGIHVLQFPSPEMIGPNAGVFELTDDEKAVQIRTELAQTMGKSLPQLETVSFEPASAAGPVSVQVKRVKTQFR